MISDETIKRIICEADLLDKYHQVLEKENDVENHLLEIKRNYSEGDMKYSDKCASAAQALLMKILSNDSLKEIHSAKYRVKTVESLLTKYVKKKALLPKEPGNDYNIEKYRPMNGKNYHKIITDLIGIRILIRYQKQWELVHNWIWKNFFKGEEKYIKNWLKDYSSDEINDFVVEKPKVYLRSSSEIPIYQVAGEDVFTFIINEQGYRSLHYLLWYDKKYIEIQVRTVYDEAWGECTHDLVYKCKIKSKRILLERLSQSLAIQTQAAEMITNLLYDESNEKTEDLREIIENNEDAGIIKDEGYEKIQKKIRRMNQKRNKREEAFDGSIDSLI